MITFKQWEEMVRRYTPCLTIFTELNSDGSVRQAWTVMGQYWPWKA